MKKNDHQLVQDVLDGELDREGFDSFQQRLRSEPELVRLYGDYALLHHTLHEECEGGHSRGEGLPAQRNLRGIRVPLALAMLALLLAGFWLLRPHLPSSRPGEVAMGTFSLDAVWQIDGGSRSIGAATAVAEGTSVHLRQGRAVISLNPAIRAVIEGPATVRIRTSDALHLAEGRGYFECGGNSGGLTVSTPELTAVDSGTVFGIASAPDTADEVHVVSGVVRVGSTATDSTLTLGAGQAARVSETGALESFPARGDSFATGLGRFTSILAGPFEKERWRIQHGNPTITEQRIEGANYAIFLRLPQPEPSAGNTVMLASLDTGKSADGEFHTDGWAGLSFFSNGAEMLFFGDSFGTKPTWSLDVKQRVPVIVPEQAVTGPRRITLRYDSRSGEVSLHEGETPLSPPFCSGKLPPGISFDEIRIGASAGAAMAVDSLQIRVGGG